MVPLFIEILRYYPEKERSAEEGDELGEAVSRGLVDGVVDPGSSPFGRDQARLAQQAKMIQDRGLRELLDVIFNMANTERIPFREEKAQDAQPGLVTERFEQGRVTGDVFGS